MQIKTRTKNEVAILDMEGQFDMEAQGPVESAVKAHLANKGGCVVWNFKDVDTITGAGIAILFNACADIKKHGGLTTLVNVRPAVIDVLEVHKVLQAFNVFTNEDAAVKQSCLCRQDMSHIHKRLYIRVEVDLKAVFRKFKPGRHADTYSRHEARVTSLSRRGAFMQSSEKYPTGTVLELKVELAGVRDERPLRFLARVVRTGGDVEEDARRPGMALSIVNIEEEDKRRLEEFLHPLGG